jgi:hypothetical protein
MTVMQTCSLTEKGPGLRDHTYPKVLKFLVGKTISRPLPKGRETSWTTMPVIKTEGTEEAFRSDESITRNNTYSVMQKLGSSQR